MTDKKSQVSKTTQINFLDKNYQPKVDSPKRKRIWSEETQLPEITLREIESNTF
jgi:hypothetical protein